MTIENENATVNSNMLPHGPRPTTMPRRSSEAPSRTAAGGGQPRSPTRDRGLGEAESVGPPVAARVDVGHERAGHDARVGRLASGAETRGVPPGARWRASPRARRGPRTRAPRRSTPREKRTDESSAMVIASGDAWARQGFATGLPRVSLQAQATAAPPGLGPAERRATTARGLTLSTRPQLVQVSTRAGRPRPHIGQSTARSSWQRSQRMRARRVDQAVAAAVRQARREDRLRRRRRSRRPSDPPRHGSTFTRGLRTW